MKTARDRTTTAGASDLESLARAAARLNLADVPEAARRHAVAVIADTVGVMLAGGLAPEMTALADASDDPLAVSSGGRAQLVTPGYPQADALTAAFLNASAGTVAELDEFVAPGAHPAVHVVPAALAAAQVLGSSGSELLAAVITGYEVAARLFRQYRLDPLVQPHGHLAAVGAAVAVARLLGRDPGTAASIAASMPLLTLWEPSFEGATVHHTYAGVGAAVGILANRLALAGFTGSRRAVEIAFGDVAGEERDSEALRRPVDPTSLLIEHNVIKLHSCCGRTYSAVDAVLSLGRMDPDSVQSVDVEITPRSVTLARQPQPNALSSRFSVEYAVAAAIVHGHAQPSAFAPDEASLALARKVNVRVPPGLAAAGPEDRTARVRVHDAGRILSAEVGTPTGFLKRPLPAGRLREKFEVLARDPSTGFARANYDRLMELESLTDLSGLLTP
jgi:2-methylcitrate dehydratase PrpD